jgi:hypothetical protein
MVRCRLGKGWDKSVAIFMERVGYVCAVPNICGRLQLVPEKGRCVLPQLFGDRPLLPLLQADTPRVP